ncbi:MAG TPA: AAA family ATPase [Bacteroidetes bacterium]|nr:MAG: AAA family ATPase [Ignavibacteria bacterium RIFCSPHIGHO2_02_FULL_56_12]HAV22870.1 AAA family ATPase [Bacteroidota bacterium]
MTDLFGPSSPSAVPLSAPLAERLRPTTLDAFVGQSHLLASGMSLRTLIERGEVSSMIFWGPPGVGKTTLARLIARHVKADFQQLNAVASGVKEVRDVISRAEKNRRGRTLATLLFIDEIHRFNKSQQDALLHAVEDGTLTLIGATTENPSFEVISPLLSRCQVYVLQSLGAAELGEILDRAMKEDIMLKELRLSIEDRTLLMLLSGGDARKLLNGLEIAVRIAGAVRGKPATITKHHIEQAYQRSASLYDKEGEQHYDIISAFIKSMRGSDPDAALYWMARMIDAGEDPKFIVRRMVVLASEDIGNADPQALSLAVSCFNAVDVIGMPEARIIMAQTAVYLASAPKSNASYLAVEHALEDARTFPNLPVPLHIRNAPTKLLKDLGYGSGYKYSHDFKGHFEEQQYLPDKLKDKVYYQPTEQGEEKSIKERLKAWWKRRRG